MTLLASVLLWPQAHQLTSEQLYETKAPSVVTLSVERANGNSGSGTAFLALSDNLAVTAWHVVKGAQSVTAKFCDGSEIKVAGIVDKNEEYDVALLRLESGSRHPLALATSEPKVGSKAFVIGSPKGLDFSISDGIISQTPYFGDTKLLQFTCPVSAGNSGGPLFNTAGEVVGVVSWQLKDAQNLNFAIPASVIGKLDNASEVKPFASDALASRKLGEPLVSVNDDDLKNLLKQAELAPTASDDGTGANSFTMNADGVQVTLFQYVESKGGPTENLGLSAAFSSDSTVGLDKINAFNRSHRFARAHRDGDGTVYLENDLELKTGVGSGNILQFVTDFNDTAQRFLAEVFAKPVKTATSRHTTPSTDGEELLVTVNEQQLLTALKAEGESVESNDDGTGKMRFDVRFNGHEAVLYQFTDSDPRGSTTSLTLAAGFQTSSAADLKKVNAFNTENRFSKAFIDADGDLFLVADLDLHGGVTMATIESFVRRFKESVNTFMRRTASLHE